MRIFNLLKKPLLFLLMLFIVNSFISFVWLPAESTTEFTAQEYQKCSDLDTVFLGSSLCQRSFVPTIIDEIAGTNSFNMGTSAQSLNQTYVALQVAHQKHNLRTAIIAMNYSNLKQGRNPHADVSFLYSFCDKLPFLQKIRYFCSFIFSPQQLFSDISINSFFPWVYNNAGFNPKGIIDNALIKLKRTEITAENYIGKGFRYTGPHLTQTLDYTTSPDSSADVYSGSYNDSAFDTLKRICRFCSEENISLIFINTPCPEFDILMDSEEYIRVYHVLHDFFLSNGSVYYDFNFAFPELFQNADHYYSDFEHMNKAGCEAFSEAFGRFLLMQEDGTDVSSLFYTPKEYLNSIDQIALVDFDVIQSKDKHMVYANALIGIDASIEYEFILIDSATNQQQTFQSYSTLSTASIPPLSTGEYMIRVNARQGDSNEEYERYCVQPISIF